jgi:hypothetical protein
MTLPRPLAKNWQDIWGMVAYGVPLIIFGMTLIIFDLGWLLFGLFIYQAR